MIFVHGWSEAMSTNSRLDMNFCRGVDSGRVSWAEAMSIYNKLDEFGWMVG
jgi:hypothetical protein